MRLIDLHPKLDIQAGDTYLSFDCPKCSSTDLFGRISIPVGKQANAWQRTGTDFDDMTIRPSVWSNKGQKNPTACDVHFYITNGEIEIL